MDQKHLSKNKGSGTMGRKNASPVFIIVVMMFLLVMTASGVFLYFYHPGPSVPPPKITLEQKMAHLETGAPLPGQETRPELPRWMMMIIFGFTLMQIFPLMLAAHKSRSSKLTARDLRQIEFLTETPLFLGLLGSLLGVFLTQFISGTLSAPLAYLTTISGILLFLFGRFTILLSLPPSNQNISE